MNISDIIKEAIKWFPLKDNKSIYVCEEYPAKDCFLKMNDFPEDPLWTIFFYGEHLDFDDDPTQWEITY